MGTDADSFAGEKERKTLEALLYTPLTESCKWRNCLQPGR
jgi:ABC-type Na+ efflux pump permease subunit